jgi:hypothetical protein
MVAASTCATIAIGAIGSSGLLRLGQRTKPQIREFCGSKRIELGECWVNMEKNRNMMNGY